MKTSTLSYILLAGTQTSCAVGRLGDSDVSRDLLRKGSSLMWSDDDENDDLWDDDDEGAWNDPTAAPTSMPVGPVCEDPVTAVLEILKCVEDEDASCAAAGYSNKFQKIHNGVDTNTDIGFGFWTGAFVLLDFVLTIDHAMQIGPNRVSVRYVETVTTTDGSNMFLGTNSEYPFSQSFDQHEHALVTVNSDCKIVVWDQYGDDREQIAVEDAADAIVCRTNPFCFNYTSN